MFIYLSHVFRICFLCFSFFLPSTFQAKTPICHPWTHFRHVFDTFSDTFSTHFRHISGSFRDIFGKFPGIFREMSGNFPGNFREISGLYLPRLPISPAHYTETLQQQKTRGGGSGLVSSGLSGCIHRSTAAKNIVATLSTTLTCK